MKTMVMVLFFGVCVIPTVWAQVSTERREVTNVPLEALRNLTAGMRESDVETELGKRGNHQFSAQWSNSVIRCVAYHQCNVYGKYYLVFTNRCLSAICDPPRKEMVRVPYRGSWLNKSILGDPEVRISRVLESTNLLGTAFGVASKRDGKANRSIDPGLTAAYALTKSLCAGNAREKERAKTYATLLDKYDPYKIELGTDILAVEQRLGTPQITLSLGMETEMRYYGSIEYGLRACRELMWLAVVYDKGKVIRVFSEDFLDYDKIRDLENMKYPENEF